MNKKLEELRQAMASLQSEMENLKGKAKGEDPMQPYNDHVNMMMQQMHNMRAYMDMMADDMYARHNSSDKRHADHLQGHLPPAKTPTQMKACLKALGMDSDYEVKKPVITVAKSKWGYEVELPPLKLS